VGRLQCNITKTNVTNRSRNSLLIVLIAIAIVASLAWWNLGPRESSTEVVVETVDAAVREFSTTVVAIGAVKPQVGAEVRVGSRISGRLERLHANIGHRVERGQILAELESADLKALVARHEAAVAMAEARITDAQARLRFAETVHERQHSLFANNSTSRQALEEAVREHELTAAGLEVAFRERDLARAELDQARTNLSYATILAPISGVVASVATQEGETVAAGFDAPTFVVILDLDRLQVDTYVDEVDIGKIQVGQRGAFTVDAFPARDFNGRVSAIYPTATIQDNVVKYVVALDIDDDPDGLLRPEMTASGRIHLDSRRVLAVPTRSIRQEGGRSVVYVLEGDRPQMRPVRVGWRDGAWAEIVEGLSAGERVALDLPATSR
jgi:RND family efflux transporter MFP subunit